MASKYFNDIANAQQVFTPGAPVTEEAAFLGRKGELDRVVEAITAPGRHPIIFGERGVGKSSLAMVLCSKLANVITVRIQCDGSDTFDRIWGRVLSTATLEFKKAAFGLNQQEELENCTLASLLGRQTRAAPLHL